MNKKEFIEKLKEYGAWCTECHDINEKKDRYVKAAKVRELLEQLDEPQKVKVPAFVAEYIEKLKNTNSRYGVELEKAYHDEENSDLANWLWFNKNTLTLFKALENGYEVEEEPKWKIINDQKYCLTSIEAGYGNSLHWAFDSTKKKPILFDNEETALYTAHITGGTVEKV